MDRWLRAFVVWWHGEGDVHQKDFYVCNACHRIITWRYLQFGGCPCQATRLSPAPVTRGLMFRALFLPWTITPWAVRQRAVAYLKASFEERRALREQARG